jgi:ArsR family transcriptional regulator
MNAKTESRRKAGRAAGRARAITRCCAPAASTRVAPRAAVRWARVYRALGDETRLEILGLLAAAPGPICACEIEANFRLTQPTISHHLRVLREAGLVSAEKRGLWVYYGLEREALGAAGGLAAVLR